MLSSSPKTSFFRPVSVEKSFEDFVDVVPMKNSEPQIGRARFTAKELKANSSDPIYDDTWYILMRQGLFGAQIEKAMAHIYKYFLGYSTQIGIVRDKDDFYAASHGIKNFLTWIECLSHLKIAENGRLVFVRDGKEKPVIGLGKLAALTEFFVDSDGHTGNFGLQERDDVCVTFKIDNEAVFSFDHEGQEGFVTLEGDLKNLSTLSIANKEWYINEKQEMRYRLAQTDFSVIAEFLTKTITSSKRDSGEWLIKTLLKNNVGDEAELRAALEGLKHSSGEGELEDILKKLQARHTQLRQDVGYGCGATEMEGFGSKLHSGKVRLIY